METDDDVNEAERRQQQTEKEEDPIQLRCCDIETKWQFPQNVLKCTVVNCQKEYNDRSKVIAHYKEYHAIHSILCPICIKPIISKGSFGKFKMHYQRKHGNVKLPYDLKYRTISNVSFQMY